MKILVAEDEPITAAVLKKKLIDEGYEVLAVTDGREAIEAIDIFSPDLIITDILMPLTSGLELIGIVKSRTDKKIPIIVLSAMGQESIVLEAFEIGADDFLTKPFNAVELIMRVKRFAVKKKK